MQVGEVGQIGDDLFDQTLGDVILLPVPEKVFKREYRYTGRSIGKIPVHVPPFDCGMAILVIIKNINQYK